MPNHFITGMLAISINYLFFAFEMERLMQYIWQHRLWMPAQMATVNGRRIQVLDPGRLNTDAGPDFFNAKIMIGEQKWAGDVEIHVRASDWHRHHHDGDPAYESVILHVVRHDDMAIRRADGQIIPQLRMECASDFHTSYSSLLNAAAAPTLPCAQEIRRLERVHLRGWLDRLAFERLHAKADRVHDILRRTNGDWESACFITLARALGFGVNSDPFERLAASIPLAAAGKHSDSMLSIQALLFGQAGLLPSDTGNDRYVELLQREYSFLSHKFGLTPPASLGWKMARMRPANFPHRRIAFLAAMLFGGFKLMSAITEAKNAEEILALFNAPLTGYWETHYHFGKESPDLPTLLSISSRRILAINVAAPILYAWGTSHNLPQCHDAAITLLQELPPESNSVVNIFASAGVKCPDAFTSQALIQLRREYCETRKCLYCRIGHRMLARKAFSANAEC